MMNGWFGESWGSPFNQDSEQFPTPVGEECASCRQPIQEGDRGVVMPMGYSPDDSAPGDVWRWKQIALHLDCYMYKIVGSVFCQEPWKDRFPQAHERYHALKGEGIRPFEAERSAAIEYDATEALLDRNNTFRVNGNGD